MLVAGAATIIIGGTFLLVVPVSPHTAWFLTEEERDLAVDRVAREHASLQHSEWRWDQAYETLRDPLVSDSRLRGGFWFTDTSRYSVLPHLLLGILHLRNFGGQLWLDRHQWLRVFPSQGEPSTPLLPHGMPSHH